ncbi:CaiB/BaiF CoA transferase family protein [Limnohabitans sp.]|jgi:crotonobetainyl-CoA:carnitine CoA-transferase CaiB-like acyl-CoA transferase|uniref:CaiB/BaiF CoA transferase family protein n=1 Tax=Limnohabitans sp. TaxID=1907725 RepID=UPI0037BE4B6A
MTATTSSTSGPLQGIRILDMATVVAAPFAATLCGDMGAEVTKLELPDGSDTLRHMLPVMGKHSLFWKVTNRGKRGITLDVRKPEGRAILLKMLPRYDVLVENFRTGTLDRWGLDLQTLHAHNPDLIVLRLTGFGQTGPYARRPGFARIFEAMSGFAHLTGESGRSPQHMNYPLGDAISGLFGAFSIATALAGRARSTSNAHRGCEIDLSATEALMRMLDPLPVEYQHQKIVRDRMGARAAYSALSNIFATKDGQWLTIVGTSGATYRRIFDAIGRADLLEGDRLASSSSRLQHSKEVDGIVADWCLSLPLAEIQNILTRYEVPHSKVNSIADLVADPHVQARNALIQLPDSDLGHVAAPCVVPRFSNHASVTPRSGPGVGEHNAEVFGEFGVGPEELTRLNSLGVV